MSFDFLKYLKMEKRFVKGSEIDTITTIRTIKGIMIDLFRGYPAHIYFGIIEGRFEKGLGSKVVDKLEHDGLIEVDSIKKPDRYYCLTPKGVDFAISMINLEHSEKFLHYSKKMNFFTIVVIILGALTLFLSGLTFYFQFLKF